MIRLKDMLPTFVSLIVIIVKAYSQVLDCQPGEQIAFEIVPGAIFITEDSSKLDQFQTFDITECVDRCRNDAKCMSANFETGFCSYSIHNSVQKPDSLRTEDFPVFPTYLEKLCLAIPDECESEWQFERVPNHELLGKNKKSVNVASKKECLNACLSESSFICRSAELDYTTFACTLSDMSRQVLTTQLTRVSAPRRVDYFENMCAPEPRAYCEFNRIKGRVLKTSNLVKSKVESEEECRKLCVDATFACQYYHYAQLSEDECSISHHTSTTLAHISEPYVFSADFTSYEVRGCFDVDLTCLSRTMIATITTNRLFDGMAYARTRPKQCSVDVRNTTSFEVVMPLDGEKCDTKLEANGIYSNYIMIQNHDTIVTSRDMGLSVTCEYDLKSRNVSSLLGASGNPSITENVHHDVPAPVVEMSITDIEGNRIMSATVGEKIYLQFDLVSQQDVYGIFVKDVVAMDGFGKSTIMLIDSNGCPADNVVLGPVASLNAGRTLRIPIECFKFPFNDEVEYMALIKPCHTMCQPNECNDKKNAVAFTSYGRKKRSLRNEDHILDRQNEGDLIMQQRLIVRDMIGRDLNKCKDGELDCVERSRRGAEKHDTSEFFSNPIDGTICIHRLAIAISCSAFILLQLVLIFFLACVCRRYQQATAEAQAAKFLPRTTTNIIAPAEAAPFFASQQSSSQPSESFKKRNLSGSTIISTSSPNTRLDRNSQSPILPHTRSSSITSGSRIKQFDSNWMSMVGARRKFAM